MSQLAYTEQGELLAGMKADSGFDDILSGLAEGAVPFGRLVSVGTDKERQVLLPASALSITDKKLLRGVAIHTHAVESELGGSNPPGYKDEQAVSYMREGRVAVEVEEAVTPDDDVFVNFQNGDEGKFRTDAGGGDAAELANARWVKGTSGAGIAILEVRLAG